jgi:hypothetical protein
MAMGPIGQQYDYFLVMQFVDTRFNQRRNNIYRAFEAFFGKFGPILEEVRISLDTLGGKAYRLVNSQYLKTSIEHDVRYAQKSLAFYEDSFRDVHEQLEALHRGEGAKEFLAKQGIDVDRLPEQVNMFLEEIGYYWEGTYGISVDKLERARGLLAKMVFLLKAQINELKVLGGIPDENGKVREIVPYVEGFDRSKKLRELFDSEYKAFYDMKAILMFSKKEKAKVMVLYNISIEKARDALSVYREFLNKSHGILMGSIDKKFQKEELNSAEVKNIKKMLMKSAMTLFYMGGFVALITNFEYNESRNVIDKILGGILGKKDMDPVAIKLYNETLDALVGLGMTPRGLVKLVTFGAV